MSVAMKISLVEYDAGNLPSVERALARQGMQTERAATPEAIRAADTLILPGVGHFGQLMRTLSSRGLTAPLREAIERGTPLLGICLGLQALFAESDEAPGDAGLGIFPQRVAALAAHRQAAAHGMESAAARAPFGAAGRRSRRRLFLFRAHLRGAGCGRRRRGAVRSCGAVRGRARARAICSPCSFIPEKSGETGARVLANFVAHAAIAQRARS